ncbi:hypothetical protein ABZ896_17025 [Streptomyces sp. NPDC047072]|uniref:hypothetical protein n=1 Tax=Streptomyces sp. NPDC047072 TaxID=3154809 RepID=UPI003410C60F
MSYPPPSPHPYQPPQAPQPDQPTQERTERWSAVATVVSAVVAVLTFLVGFIGLPAAGVSSPTGGTATVTATVRETVTATETATAGGSSGTTEASPSVLDSVVRWAGPILVGSGSGFDLDTLPPEESTFTGPQDFQANVSDDGTQANFPYGQMAVVPRDQDPSYEDCVLLAKTQPQYPLISPGNSVCLITGEKRVAVVTVTAVHREAENVSMRVSIWEKPIE